MRSFTFLALQLAFLWPFPVLAAASTGTCPVAKDKFRDISDAQIDQLCFQPAQAQTPVRNPGGRMAAVRRCRENLLQAKESANVVYATDARQATFHPEVTGALDQKTAPAKAAQVLIGAHVFTNISMAALYRSLLKVHKQIGQNKKEQTDLQTEQASTVQNRDAMVQAEQSARAQGNPAADRLRDQEIPAFAKDLQAIAVSNKTVQDSANCLDLVQPSLDSTFEAWANVKKELLAKEFKEYVTTDRYPDPDDFTNAQTAALSLQESQQQVYDNLTDPSKRSFAYGLAEKCDEENCRLWASAGKVVGFVSRTPVITAIARAITAGISALKSTGQGLDMWQTLREAGNASIPGQPPILDTEVGAIEKGEVRPFNP